MAIQYHQAPILAPNLPITSRDYNELALAFNDRLKNGVGDPSWRIIWYVHSLFRDIRNRISDDEFPDEDEWWKFWSHLDSKYSEDNTILWPSADVGDEGGISVGNPLMGWLFGRQTSPDDGYGSEGDRMTPVDISIVAITPGTTGVQPLINIWPLYFYPRYLDPIHDVIDQESLDTTGVPWKENFGRDDDLDLHGEHAPQSVTEEWLLGLTERGAYDPEMGIDAPAFTQSRIFYGFQESLQSPFVKSYTTYAPIPELAQVCYQGPSSPPIPVYNLIFTNLNDNSTITYPGKCPGEEGSVLGVFQYDNAYYIYIQKNGNVVLDRVLSLSEWIEGPYTSGSSVTKRHGEQIDEAINYFALNFRGSINQRFNSSCYDVRRIGFDFEKFLNTQYLLAPAYGIGFKHDNGDSTTSILVREVYPRWNIKNTTGSLVNYAIEKTLDCRYISSVVEVAGVEQDTYTDLTNQTKDIFDGFQVSGVYIYAEGLINPITLRVSSPNNITPIQIVLSPDVHGKVNMTKWFNTPGVIAPIEYYGISLAPNTNLPANSTITVDVLEQVISKPSIPDIYTVLRMATCKFPVGLEGYDSIPKYIDSPNVIFDVYFNKGYIPNIEGAPFIDTYIEPWPSPLTIYEQARELFHRFTRLADRAQLIGYEVTGGKSILHFQRFAWPEGTVDDVPPAVLNSIATVLPQGQLEVTNLVNIQTLENAKKYIITKLGTVAPNQAYLNGSTSVTVYDKVAYGMAVSPFTNVYDPYTEGSSDGLVIGNDTQFVDTIFELDPTLYTSVDYPLVINFAISFDKCPSTNDNGFNWKIERRQFDSSDNPMEPWKVVALNGGYSKTYASTGYVYLENEHFSIGVAKVRYRFTGTPALTRTNDNVAVYEQAQSGIVVGQTYVIKGQDNRVFTSDGQAIDIDAHVIYPSGSTNVDDEYRVGETITGGKHKDSSNIVGDATMYDIVTGKERVYQLVLDGIIDGHHYLVKGPGYVTYPSGTGTHYGEGLGAGNTFVGGGTSTYNISDGKTVLYDTEDTNVGESVRQGFDVFDGIAPSRQPADFNYIVPGVVYKVGGTAGAVTYNGTDHAIGTTITGISGHSSYVPNPVGDDARLYALTGSIIPAAYKKSVSNEWQMFINGSAYHPSESSLWHPTNYSNQIAFLNNRCHLYSPDLASIAHENLNTQFAYGESPVSKSEAPSGYTYLEGTHDPSTHTTYTFCDAFDDDGFQCEEQREKDIKSFYKSCQIYKKDYEIESVELSDIDGEVKVTFKTRFDHDPDAPDTISIERIDNDSLADDPDLRAEPYRTDENIIREYIHYIASNPHEDFPHTGAQNCTRYKIGDFAPGSLLPQLSDNPFGACFPRFYFLKKVPYVYAEPGEPATEAAIPEPPQDTRREVDHWAQMEFYARAMCGGFLDRDSTRKINCSNSDGTSRMVDYTFENLIYQATRRAEATKITAPDVTWSPIYELNNLAEDGELTAQVLDGLNNHITWTLTFGVTNYNIFRRTIEEVTDEDTGVITFEYTDWEEVTSVASPAIIYTDIISLGPERHLTEFAYEYEVRNSADDSQIITSTLAQTHFIGWNVDEAHLYEVYRRENSSMDRDNPNWTAWHKLPPTSGLYSYPDTDSGDDYTLTTNGKYQIQYKVRLIKGFQINWPATPGRLYLLQRKITRDFDSDEDYLDVEEITALNNPAIFLDAPPNTIPPFTTKISADVSDEVTFSDTELTGSAESLTVTRDEATIVVTPQSDDTNLITWTAGGFTWYIRRRYKSADQYTQWRKLGTDNTGSYLDTTYLPPEIADAGTIEYKVEKVTVTAPTISYDAHVGKWYKIRRTTSTVNGDVITQNLYNPTSADHPGYQYAFTTETVNFDDPAVITPMVESIAWKVYVLSGNVIKYHTYDTNNPAKRYFIYRVVDNVPTLLVTKTESEAVSDDFTYTDTFAGGESDVVTYNVSVFLVDPIRDISYQVYALGVGVNRWISPMPVSKRPDRPKGFGPLPNTCMHASMFNTYAYAINFLLQARIDLPMDIQCQSTSSEGNLYAVRPDCYSTSSGFGAAIGGDGSCAFNDDGSCSGAGNTFTNTAGGFQINNVNRSAIVHGFPVQYGPDVISSWQICGGGIAASKSAGFSTSLWACDSNCSRVPAGSASNTRMKMRVVPNGFSQDAMSSELQIIVKKRGLGFYGLETTSSYAESIVPVETPEDTSCFSVLDNGTDKFYFYLRCNGAQYWSSQATVDTTTTQCKFYEGSAQVTAPPLPQFDAGFYSVVGIEFGGTRASSCGGASTSQIISIPDASQFVTFVSVPTVKP